MKFCCHCGSENSETERVCAKCGGAEFAATYGEYLDFKFSGKAFSAAVKPDDRFEAGFGFGNAFEEHSFGTRRENASGFPTVKIADTEPAVPVASEGFEIAGEILTDYKGSDKKVVLPQGIKTIDYSAFSRNAEVEEIFISDGVEKIEKRAFFQCVKLKKIRLPESLLKIGDEAFSGCGRLEAVVLPEKLEYIGEFAFSFCGALQSVTIPSGVKRIGSRAFGHCTSLKRVVMPKNPPVTGWAAFDKDVNVDLSASGDGTGAEIFSASASDRGFMVKGNTLIKYNGSEKTVAIPSEIRIIGSRAFAGSAVENVYLHENLRIIEDGAFADCTGLKKMTLTSGVLKVGAGAFEGCTGLEELEIEKGVAVIERNAFADCKSLSQVYIPLCVNVMGENVFYGSGVQTVTCAYHKRPSGWDKDWNVRGGRVFGREKINVQWGAKAFIHDGCIVHRK